MRANIHLIATIVFGLSLLTILIYFAINPTAAAQGFFEFLTDVNTLWNNILSQS